MNRLSLSWRLSFSYAAIALLTAFVSGAAMLSLLANYYDRAEHTALIQSADRVVDDLSRTGLAGHPTSITATQAQALAVVADARVRVYDFAHKLLADSGPVENVDAGAFLAPGRLRFFGMQRFPGMRPSPFGGGPLGMAGTTPIERSANVIAWAQIPLSGRAIGFVELSDPPAYGRDLLVGAGEAWMLASLLAVAVAFAVGWRLSKRITTPLAALTSASDWMAEGDLGARAVVPGGDEFGRLAASFNGMADRVEETGRGTRIRTACWTGRSCRRVASRACPLDCCSCRGWRLGRDPLSLT